MSKFEKQNLARNDGHLVNEQIRDAVVDVIDGSGAMIEGMSTKRALELAQEASLDLVKVGEKDGRTIAKIMDFGKFIYAKKKKIAKSKKAQKVIQVKEIKMRPKIGPGDYETKLKAAERFLKEGKHVKFTLQFKGRQPISVRDVGTQFFEKLRQDLLAKDVGTLAEEKETRSNIIWSKIFYVKN